MSLNFTGFDVRAFRTDEDGLFEAEPDEAEFFSVYGFNELKKEWFHISDLKTKERADELRYAIEDAGCFTALCVWEYVLEHQSDFDDIFERYGWAETRGLAQATARMIDAAYCSMDKEEILDHLGCFDFELVPEIVKTLGTLVDVTFDQVVSVINELLMQQKSDNAFSQAFTLISSPNGEPLVVTNISAFTREHIWSICTGDNGDTYLRPGVATVNGTGEYVVTAEPNTDTEFTCVKW